MVPAPFDVGKWTRDAGLKQGAEWEVLGGNDEQILLSNE